MHRLRRARRGPRGARAALRHRPPHAGVPPPCGPVLPQRGPGRPEPAILTSGPPSRARWATGASVDVRAVSRIPRAAGSGSSAALSAGLVAALSSLSGGVDRPTLAQRSFEVERGAQGVGSPGDTSAAVAGGFLSVNAAGSGPLLWTVREGARSWEVRRVADPGWVWVVAHSGIPRATGDAVRAVGTRLAQPDGPGLLDEFRTVATEGTRAVAAGRSREGRGPHEPEPGAPPRGGGLPPATRGPARSGPALRRRREAHGGGGRRLDRRPPPSRDRDRPRSAPRPGRRPPVRGPPRSERNGARRWPGRDPFGLTSAKRSGSRSWPRHAAPRRSHGAFGRRSRG